MPLLWDGLFHYVVGMEYSRSASTMVSMILVRFVRWLRSALPYMLMAILFSEGLLAAAAMFIFPPLSVLLVFVGLGTIAVYVLTGWVLTGLDQVLAKAFGVPVVEC